MEAEKTLDHFQSVVARKYHLGEKLVTGHRKSYFDEATDMYIRYLFDRYGIMI